MHIYYLFTVFYKFNFFTVFAAFLHSQSPWTHLLYYCRAHKTYFHEHHPKISDLNFWNVPEIRSFFRCWGDPKWCYLYLTFKYFHYWCWISVRDTIRFNLQVRNKNVKVSAKRQNNEKSTWTWVQKSIFSNLQLSFAFPNFWCGVMPTFTAKTRRE